MNSMNKNIKKPEVFLVGVKFATVLAYFIVVFSLF